MCHAYLKEQRNASLAMHDCLYMQVLPDTAAANIALGALIDAGQLQASLSLVADMHDTGLHTSAPNCNSLVMLLVTAGQSPLALKVAQVCICVAAQVLCTIIGQVRLCCRLLHMLRVLRLLLTYSLCTTLSEDCLFMVIVLSQSCMFQQKLSHEVDLKDWCPARCLLTAAPAHLAQLLQVDIKG